MTLNPTLNTDPIRNWIVSTLAKSGLDRPDGRWLFAYNQSRSDFEQLEQLLKDICEEAGSFSQLIILRKKAFSALFVFYAAGWWKNSYPGGAWDWSPIVESIGGDLHSFPQQLRSACVTLGLRFWGHKPLEQGEGRRYIGAIAVHGGIPMKLLALGTGRLSAMLTQVLRQAGRYSWNIHQIEDAVEQYQHQLPAAYRRPEIANLLATFIETVLQLKSEFKLAERINPIQYLDAEVPGWRNRFPISMEVDAAQTLLVCLVREASAQRATTTADIFRCERCLIESAHPGIYSIESVVTHSNRIAADTLAQYFGLNGSDALPRYLGIDLEVETRHGMIEGRFVLGAAEPVVSLTGRKISFKGVAALMEHRLVLRDHNKDLSERRTASGGGALLHDEPMVFERTEVGNVRFIASGSVRVRSETAIVALPGGWVVECEDGTTPERIGTLDIGGTKLSVLEVNRDSKLIHGELKYRIRTRQSATSVEMYQWSGARLQEAHGRQVFQDKLPPLLFRADEDGLIKVPEADQRWTRAGGNDVVQPKDARGPVDVVVSRDGETVARQRIFVLPASARIRYISGEGVGNGSIRFMNWGSISVSVVACPEVTCQISKTTDTDCLELSLSTSGVPPPEVRVYIKWSGSPAELSLHLPYPVTGGRFIRGDIGVLAHGSKVSVRELVGLRLQVFDTNPMNPKLYKLKISMETGNREIYEQHQLELDSNARADIRLIDYQKTVESFLGLSDDLDANVRIGLIVGNVKATEIHMARFACSLESGPHCVGLDAARSPIGAGTWESLKVLANPIKDPTREPIQLARFESEGVYTHAWGTEVLDPEQSPWLIYPAEDSAIDFRPRLWAGELSSGTDEIPSTHETTGCPLAMALAIGDPGERWNQLKVVLGCMSTDLAHESWPLLHGLWNRYHHLPLSALDVWRMLGKQSQSLLAFILRSPIADHELTRALRRFRDETGWTPELNTLNDWREVVATFWTYWKGQLSENEGLAKTVFMNQLESRLTLLKNEFHSLELVLDFIFFEVGNQPPQSLIALGSPSNVKVDLRLKNLWIGGESLVNTQLFLVNAHRGGWPKIGFFEEALAAFDESISESDKKILEPLFKRLFWLQPGDFKMTAANMPMLCALWVATSTSRKWWGAPKNRLALRRLRDFDPVWFEQCFKHSFAVLLSVQGLIKLQEIVHFLTDVQEMKFNE